MHFDSELIDFFFQGDEELEFYKNVAKAKEDSIQKRSKSEDVFPVYYDFYSMNFDCGCCALELFWTFCKKKKREKFIGISYGQLPLASE